MRGSVVSSWRRMLLWVLLLLHGHDLLLALLLLLLMLLLLLLLRAVDGHARHASIDGEEHGCLSVLVRGHECGRRSER